jgi:TonB family protein
VDASKSSTPVTPVASPASSTGLERAVGPLYTPTWWERRFPWLLDVLAALDPDPIGRALDALFAPLRDGVTILVEPVAAALETVWVGATALGSAMAEWTGAAARALPLPGPVRRTLWLAPFDPELRTPGGAQLALRRQHGVLLPLALMAAAGAHALVLTLSPPFATSDFATVAEEIRAIELPPDIQIPPPPREIARPATPVITTAEIDEDITIAPTTFDDYVRDDLPPPPAQATVDETRQPTFTPFTVGPRILNTEEIKDLMAQEYPPLLREARLGGVVVVWAFITAEGTGEEVMLARPSGHPELDAAALRIAPHLRCSPALNRDVRVPVWIQLPFEFEVAR